MTSQCESEYHPFQPILSGHILMQNIIVMWRKEECKDSLINFVIYRVPQKKVGLVCKGYFPWSKMDDTAGNGTVFCCRPDENSFENLSFHFGVKNSHFWPQNKIWDFQNYFHLNGNKKLCQYLQYHPFLTTESNLKKLIPPFF